MGDGITLGTPICIMVPNTDQKSQDYSEMAVAYRPSHADATYDMKYGIRAVSNLSINALETLTGLAFSRSLIGLT